MNNVLTNNCTNHFEIFFRGSISSHHLNPCSNLVSLLCRKDRLNRLLVTLLPNNEGMYIHSLYVQDACPISDSSCSSDVPI